MTPALPLVDLSRQLPGGRLWRPFSSLLERLLGLDRLNALYGRRRPESLSSQAFCADMLGDLGIETWIEPQGLERLRQARGPVVVVANHPLGGREALLLNILLGSARPDYRILSNRLIGMVPEVRSKLLMVDPFGGGGAAQGNRRPLRQALHWLESGGLLGVFPAGEVSIWQADERCVADGPWAPQLARLIRRCRATVVPLHFSGKTSVWLQILATVHPALKTPFLVRELLDGPARRLEARLGLPVPALALPDKDDTALAAWLRRRCYALAK